MLAASQTPGLRSLVGYFLRLGTFGFGGPIALVGHMHRDLVEERGWIDQQDYLEGLALAQLAPGPLAAQLAIYLGWVKGRVLGASAVAVAFVLPSFLMVLALSVAYTRFGGLPWIQGAFYGVGAAVIAVVARGAARLATMRLGRDRLLWTIFTLNALVTAWTSAEILLVLVASGVVVLLARRDDGAGAGCLLLLPAGLAPGVVGPATPGTLGAIFMTFAEAGAFVFGSGLAIIPFLHATVVTGAQWLTERQFLDAVAVALITPGPVVITVAFIGFLVAGFAGAAVAAVAVFLPCYLLVVVPAPYFRRIARHRSIRDLVDGVTAATTGAIAGAVLVLGRRAIVDLPSAGVGLAALLVLVGLKKVPEPAVIAAAALAGVALAGG
jgi:chromate transporter